MSHFTSFSEGLNEGSGIRNRASSLLSFGNKFLDDCTGGISGDDLIVLTAGTGAGKTETVTQIATVNAQSGKNVHFFALEATRGEIHLRIKFKYLAQAFYLTKEYLGTNEKPNYQDWLQKRQDSFLAKFEPEIDEQLNRELQSLSLYYRDTTFDINMFGALLARIGTSTDLIILDHLHYFDFEDINENKALKDTVKQIKDLTSLFRKSVILVVQLRKQDARTKGLLPRLEDIHGSSDIAKIATKVIATAPAYDQPRNSPHILPTYFKVLKNRTDGSRCRYVGLCGFDIQKNVYASKYVIGELSPGESDFIQLENHNVPRWAKAKV